MVTDAKKDFANTAERLEFTEEVKNNFLQKLQNDDNLKKKIEEGYHLIIEVWKEFIASKTVDEKSRQMVKEMISETTIEKYTNEVYERILSNSNEILKGKSLEEFYESSFFWTNFKYLYLCGDKLLEHK